MATKKPNGFHTQWKKGQSGNPHGRPKRRNSLAEMFRRILDEEVAMPDDKGGERVMTNRERLARLTYFRAEKGNMAALKTVLEGEAEEQRWNERQETEQARDGLSDADAEWAERMRIAGDSVTAKIEEFQKRLEAEEREEKARAAAGSANAATANGRAESPPNDGDQSGAETPEWNPPYKRGGNA